jgi:hypothetical protein
MRSTAKLGIWMAIGLSAALCACGGKPSIPSDAQLIAAYQTHREALNAAVAEMGHGLDVVTLKGDKVVAEPSTADAARVAKTLRKVGARSAEAGETGPETAPATAVRFAFLVPGAWGSKSIKGLVYDPAANPQDQVPDTDAFARRGEKARYVYVERRIDKDWYIYQWLD